MRLLSCKKEIENGNTSANCPLSSRLLKSVCVYKKVCFAFHVLYLFGEEVAVDADASLSLSHCCHIDATATANHSCECNSYFHFHSHSWSDLILLECIFFLFSFYDIYFSSQVELVVTINSRS
jgi:hypothetical protein